MAVALAVAVVVVLVVVVVVVVVIAVVGIVVGVVVGERPSGFRANQVQAAAPDEDIAAPVLATSSLPVWPPCPFLLLVLPLLLLLAIHA